jgi:hypothetical protein
MDFDDLVVRDGDLVTASGRLVRDHAGAWFEPPTAMAAVAAGGGPRMIRPVSRAAVRVAGPGSVSLGGRLPAGPGPGGARGRGSGPRCGQGPAEAAAG